MPRRGKSWQKAAKAAKMKVDKGDEKVVSGAPSPRSETVSPVPSEAWPPLRPPKPSSMDTLSPNSNRPTLGPPENLPCPIVGDRTKLFADIVKGVPTSLHGRCTQKCILASRHQGHARYRENGGRQCVANSLMAVITHKIKPAQTWQTNDLNQILDDGNSLYEEIHNKKKFAPQDSGFLFVTDLPSECVVNGIRFSVGIGKGHAGHVGVEQYNEELSEVFVPLDEALQRILSEYDSCFLNLDERTCVVFKTNGGFALFDPHGRNRYGARDENGVCVTLFHADIHQLYQHICILAESINCDGKDFEVTGFRVVTVRKAVSPQVSDLDPVHEKITEANIPGPSLPLEEFEVSGCMETKTMSPEVIFLGSTASPTLTYNPLTYLKRSLLCEDLNVTNGDTESTQDTIFTPMGEPCETKPITKDGNCFFRALAYVVCGSEAAHMKFRKAIVKHMLSHHTYFTSYLRHGYSSVDQYVKTSRMLYARTWATEIEIMAAVHLFGVPIFTYNTDRWNVYRVLTSDCGGVYLKHLDGSHYEVVTCVKDTLDCNRCAEVCCAFHTDKNPSKMTLRKTNLQETISDSERKKMWNKRKYESDLEYQEKKKKDSKTKYASDLEFQQRVKDLSSSKYASDLDFQQSVKDLSKRKKAKVKDDKKDIQFVTEQFRISVKLGPEFPCSVCHRLMFRRQVRECKRNVYSRKGAEAAAMANRCITSTYLHNCDTECHTSCKGPHLLKLWICSTCHVNLLSGVLPVQAVVNNLNLAPIPPELQSLNSVEEHFVARNIPFMKIVPLVRGGQNACQGPVTCVPSNVIDTVSILPRHENDDQLCLISLS